MAVQDLTPTLRTRLNRMERLVGLFITVATLLLVFGLAYYVYEVAKNRGWFLEKAYYSTCVINAAGLNPGDRVKLMGFPAGTITDVIPNDPYDFYNVTIYFEIEEPYYGYIWTDSKVKVASADLLGKRNLEVLKGQTGLPTVLVNQKAEIAGILNQTYLKQLSQELHDQLSPGQTNKTPEEIKALDDRVWKEIQQRYSENQESFYHPYSRSNGYWLTPNESPALADRMEKLVDKVEQSLPGILHLTNDIANTLTTMGRAVSNIDMLAISAQPLATNLARISRNLSDPSGSLGEWLLPTNLHARLLETLASANSTLTNSDANLTRVATSLDETLLNLANITSNLNAQVQVNSNILAEISDAVVHSDEFVQGLKRHWLLRSAFKKEAEKEGAESKPQKPIPTRGARIN